MMQLLYGDASFSSFGFDYGGMADASSSHPPPFDSPPLAQTHDDDGEDEGKEEDDNEWSLLKTSPPLFGCLMTKGEKID
jgi:hypothetical protein